MGFFPTRYSTHSYPHPTGYSPVRNRYISNIKSHITVQQEKIVRTDSAILSVSIHGAWRPVRLILTERHLICQQASRIAWSVPLDAVFRIKIVETRVLLGLKRKVLLIEVGKAKGLVCVNNPEEWKDLIRSGMVSGPQSETEANGSIANKDDLAQPERP